MVAVLLVTIGFQAVLSTPGGVWQDNGQCINTTEVGSSHSGTNDQTPFNTTVGSSNYPVTIHLTRSNTTLVCEHKAGTAIAFEDGLFQVFLACNAIIFLLSNSLIIFLVPNGYMKVLFFALNVTLCFSYSYALLAIAGDPYRAYMAGILTTISALFIFVAQLFSWKQ